MQTLLILAWLELQGTRLSKQSLVSHLGATSDTRKEGSAGYSVECHP